MLLARKSDGWRREVDDWAVAVLAGRQREKGVGHRLRQLRRLLQALLPQLLPASGRQPQISSGRLQLSSKGKHGMQLKILG